MRYKYENFLHSENFAQLVEAVTDGNFPWFAREGAVGFDEDDKDPAFSNVLCDQFGPTRKEFDYVLPILHRLNTKSVLRVKVNLDLPNKNGKVLEPESFHTDLDIHGSCMWTLILYLNDCNGATMFEEDMASVRSKANRAVIFPVHMRHTGCHQTDTTFRYIINVNFLASDLPEGGQEF